MAAACRVLLRRALTAAAPRVPSATNLPCGRQRLLAAGLHGRAVRPLQCTKPQPRATYPSIAAMAAIRRLASSSSSSTPNRAPVTWRSLALMLAVGGGMALYFKVEMDKQEAVKKQKLKKTSVGKAKIGGPFTLVGPGGKTFTEKDLKGQWSLLYFGFTFCPDICPEELEKIAGILDITDNTPGVPTLRPVFVSVDPDRDTPEKIEAYLKDFHPRMIGLTGTKDQVLATAKAYRVYYSKPIPWSQEAGKDEYLVDHTIITYLINPEGEFVAYYGQNTTAPEAAADMIKRIKQA
eukprot:m.222959 g.222959  ORF g.222959 m.222959 type:complete len:293 (+) comp18741_c1_seq1:113-991(+)